MPIRGPTGEVSPGRCGQVLTVLPPVKNGGLRPMRVSTLPLFAVEVRHALRVLSEEEADNCHHLWVRVVPFRLSAGCVRHTGERYCREEVGPAIVTQGEVSSEKAVFGDEARVV